MIGGGGCHSFLGACSLKPDARGLVLHFLCLPSRPFSLSMDADNIAVECAVLDCTNLPFAVVHHLAHMALEHLCMFVLA